MEASTQTDEEEAINQHPKSRGCCGVLQSIITRVYIAHAITTWGDRMWSFAISLFLVKMSENFDLQLTAIYGLTCSLGIIIFGAPIGRWIDSASRLTAALKAIIIQNSLVITCAAIIMFAMVNNMDYLQKRENQLIFYSIKVAVIALGASSYLASMASGICISKDWVVVICRGDKELLARVNATCRCIDLTTKISSPFLVGLIMSQMSDFAAAAFIASWNVMSMTIECLLIRSIYVSVPLLAKKVKAPQSNEEHFLTTDPTGQTDDLKITPDPGPDVAPNGTCGKIKAQAAAYISLWTSYIRHAIFPAGFGLACLYMTVLGFDGITVGYAYSQGVTEYVLGALGGAGAIVGIVSTIFYPMLRRKIGIERTGLIGFFAEVSCLLACIASIWAPGSSFQKQAILTPLNSDNETDTSNVTNAAASLNGTVGQLLYNNTVRNTGDNIQRDYTSVALLMAGIVAARFGLWLIDLTVNQIIQEEVEEQQRGAINGTQNALNMFMDLLKYILVILLPSPETFGFLILASFAVICLGWASYALYSWRKRRHILPFHQYFKNCAPINVPDLQPKGEHS